MAFEEASNGCKAKDHRHIASATLQLSNEIPGEEWSKCEGFRTIPECIQFCRQQSLISITSPGHKHLTMREVHGLDVA